jgi:hypothetical protein
LAGSGAASIEAAFAVSGVAVDVTAENAEAARTEALAEGQRRAFRRLLVRLTLAADHGRLPSLSDPVITELVRGFEVAGERVGPDRYIASLTFHFKPAEVGNLLRENGIPYAAAASDPVVVVPLFQGADGLMLWEDGNPWRLAWANLPPSDSLVPVIVPFGELADLEILNAAQARKGERARFERLAARYDVGEAIAIDAVVAAKTAQAAPTVSVSVRHIGSGGVRVSGGTYSGMAWDTLEAVLAAAAKATRDQIESEWKTANLLRFDRESRLEVDIPIAGFADWLDIRARLGGLALLRKLEIAALSPRFVRAVLHYLGDEEQLAGALARDNLTLTREADLWILRRRGQSTAPATIVIE